MKQQHFNILLLFILLAAASCKEGRQVAQQEKAGIPKVSILFRDSFPQPQHYVNDYEDLFSPAEEAKLNDVLAQWEQQQSIQVAVVTLDTNMTTASGLDSLVLKIANTWGVGQKGKNNGITIGFSKGRKKIRICNGSGISLSDAQTGKIIREDFIPFFKEEHYFEGTIHGLLALKAALR